MIAGLLQVVLVKIGSTVDTETGEKIVQLLIMIFQQLKKVTENGLIAYSGLCQGLKERVNVKDFGQYILWALEGEDEDCARVACGIISDIASSLKEKVDVYLSSFVPHLIKILKSNDHDRRTKLQALCSLGDLCIFAGVPFCQLYLTETLMILESAGQLSLKSAEFANDPDIVEYFEELRSNIIDCYNSIVGTVLEAGVKEEFFKFVPGVLSFLQALAKEQN